jgi:hypothetical protein
MSLQEENRRGALPVTLVPVIPYAEPSTALSVQTSSKNGYFKLFAFAALLFALMFIGGTLGSIFIDLVPPRPWEAQVSVAVRGPPILPGELAAIKRDRNLIAANPLAKVFNAEFRSPWTPIPDDEFLKTVEVSQVQPNRSFIVKISGATENQCNRIVADYSNMPLQMPSFQGRAFQTSYAGAKLTESAARAPMLSWLIGSGSGLAAGLLFLFWRLRSGRNRQGKPNA